MELEGILEQPPELSYTTKGISMCTFYVDGRRCIAWAELGEKINQYVLPGDKVKVYGFVKERWWTENGEKKRVEDFTVNRIQVLERPKPIEECCYYCLHFNIGCMKQCFSAMGGPGFIQYCVTEKGKCTEMDNKECWKRA